MGTLVNKQETHSIPKTNIKGDGLVKSPTGRHPGGSRGPEVVNISGFRLSPE